MMPTFFPSSSSTCWLPRWKPSPVADRMTTEITPQRIPNIVRKLRSLLARRLENTCAKISVIDRLRRPQSSTFGLRSIRSSASAAGLARWRDRGLETEGRRLRSSTRQHHLVAGFDAAEDLHARAVAHTHFHRNALPPVPVKV